ncbi:MAG: ATP-binding protein [Desulfobacterales bacterium]|nr:ATP-binding protein [Desulfobacterales bacterium]
MRQVLNTFASLAVTGPRQSGKTTLLTQILPDYQYVTLDDPVTRERALADPQLFFDSLREKAIIDEIQNAPDLLSYAKIRIDTQRDRKGMLVFTGSQQFHMIKNLGDSLAGRVALLDLPPFSITEIKTQTDFASTEAGFVHACLTGSFPEPVTHPLIDTETWYGSYVQTYLERDIRSIYNIGSLRDFQRFMQLLAARCSQILNLSEFANALGITVPTVKKWISILEACRIIYLLPPYHSNLGKRITKSPKIYFFDCGLVCYLTGLKDSNHLMQGPMAGALFENYCVQETLKIYFNNGRQPKLYFLRTNNNLEIDLIIERSYQEILPVEIKLSKTPNLRMAGNMDRFRKIFTELNIAPGWLLSLSEETVPLNRQTTVINFSEYIQTLCDRIGPFQKDRSDAT